MSVDKIPDPLYFIAVVPPDPIATAVKDIKEDIAERFSSKAALRSPAHITLHMPFRWPDRKLEKLRDAVSSLAETTPRFPVSLEGFDAFVPRVIFVKVEENPALEQLQNDLLRIFRQELGIFNGNYKERPFHPHMTIAFRDLKPRNFKLAWDEYKNKPISFHFSCESITLLKHSGKEWQRFKTFPLKHNPI